MRYSTALLALLPVGIANVIRVDVGKGGLIYTPNSVQAAPGDIVEFHYHPKNHTVTQSNFANPCVPLSDGINSGFVPVADENSVASAQRFSIQVNNTRPIWIYCAQGKHCASGMSMVINEPNTKKTLMAYQMMAKNATSVANTVAPARGSFASTDLPSMTMSGAAMTTYTEAYSTYPTSTNGATTTVTLVQTVTALSSNSDSASGTGTSAAASGTSGSSASSTAATKNAAPTLGSAGWVVAAGAALFGGLIV